MEDGQGDDEGGGDGQKWDQDRTDISRDQTKKNSVKFFLYCQQYKFRKAGGWGHPSQYYYYYYLFFLIEALKI